MRGIFFVGLVALAGFVAAQNATVTRVETIYTTTTISPYTTTSVNGGSTTVVTILTTRTLTATSCQAGCSTPFVYLPVPTPRTETSIITELQTRTVTNYVPSSVLVTTIDQNPFYSTWLNVVFSVTTATLTRTAYQTFFPTATIGISSSCPAGTVCVTVTASGVLSVTLTSTVPPATNTPISPYFSPSYRIIGGPRPVVPTGGFPTDPLPLSTGIAPSGFRPRAFYL